MQLNSPRSITVPILLGAGAIALTIVMLVGWILVIVGNVEMGEPVRADAWLMLGGVLSFVVIVAVLVLFSVFLVREILEGHRQVRFIDSVTHELRSPLASLKLAVQTLARRQLTEQQRGEIQARMLDDIDRLNTFIDDILEASRIGAGEEGYALSQVNLRQLAGRCVERVQQRYRVPEAGITLDIPPDLELFTSATALETVLKNLLDNAVKYSDPPVSVTLSAHARGDRAFIEVRDRGIGIPRAHLKRVFDRFYRVPTEAVHARKGTGLGLYVVRSLVRSLGGELTAASPGESLGTTMRFSLPLDSTTRAATRARKRA